ncbi:hypothetical protein NBRC116494_12850 [Aurantivibrio plasticivorans]
MNNLTAEKTNRPFLAAKGITWHDNGLIVSCICALLVLVFFVSERMLLSKSQEVNSSILIAAEEASDSDEVGIDAAELSNDDSEYVNIIYRYLNESYSGFPALISQYPAAAPHVWLGVLERYEKEAPTAAGELIVEFARYYPNDVNFQFLLAKWHSVSGDLAGAIQTYRHILSLDNFHQASQINLGLTLLKVQDYSNAVVELDRAIEISSGIKKGKSLSAKASALMMLREYSTAEEVFAKSIEYRPSYAPAWRKLAIAQLRNEKPWNEVLATLDNALKLQPDYLLAQYNRAQLLWLMQKPEAARSELRDISKRAPEFAPARWSLAHINILTGRKNASKKSLQWISQQTLSPEESTLVRWMQVIVNADWQSMAQLREDSASLLASKDENAEMLRIAEWIETYHLYVCGLSIKSIRCSEKDNRLVAQNRKTLNHFEDPFLFSEWQLRKAEAAAADGQYKRATKGIVRLINMSPDSHLLQYQLGRWLMDAGLPADAKPYLQTAVALVPTDTQYRLSLALSFVRDGKADEAEAAYRSLLSLAPNHKIAHFNFALLLLRQDRYDEAEDQLLAALDIDSNYTNAQYNLAKLYIDTQQYDQALPHLIDLTDAVPANRRYREMLAKSYMQLAEYQQAYVEVQRLVALNPDSVSAKILLFDVQRERGELRKAGDVILNLPVEAYRPAVITKMYNLGVRALDAEDLALAELLNRQVLELDASRDKALVNLSAVLNRSGRYRETVALLSNSATLPNNEKLVVNLAGALNSLGEYKQLVALLDNYLNFREGNGALEQMYAEASTTIAIEPNIQ